MSAEPAADVAGPAVITVITRDQLPSARVLARSLRHHHPDWTVTALVLGAADAATGEAGLRVVSLAELLGLDPARMLSYRGPAQLVGLLVPRALRAVAGEGRPALHIPAAASVWAPLHPLLAALADRPALLVPRTRSTPPDDGLEPSPRRLARHGRVSDELLGVDGSPAGTAFLDWWIGRLDRIIGAPDDGWPGHDPRGARWAQRSLELALSRDDVAVLADPGGLVSAWNLFEHSLARGEPGVTVDGQLLRVLDLTGFEPDRPFRLASWATRVRLSRDPVLAELVTAHADELGAAGWRDAAVAREVGRALPSGLRFDEPLQALLVTARALGAVEADPFSADGAAALLDWARGPAPQGGHHGISRYLLHRIVRERRDVVLVFPDIDGADGPKLLHWARTIGADEMEIPAALRPEGSRTPATAPARPRAPRPAANRVPGIGVRITGFLGHLLGLGAAARGYATALTAAGVPVSTVTGALNRPLSGIELVGEYGRHRFEDLAAEDPAAFELLCVNPGELPEFLEQFGADYLRGRRIGVWAWETDRIPRSWVQGMALVDEIWVYSEFVAGNLRAATDVPVSVLPPPVRAPARFASQRLGVPDGFLFLFVFDYSSTIQRKNPEGVIEAFARAFAPGEGPQLLIKTINAPLLPLDEEAVLWAARGRPDVHVIDRSLPAEEVDALMGACDCYVSLHRSEGLGLTMAEAMTLGKPVIATGYSGNVDFMNAENSFLVGHGMALVGPDCLVYPADGEWAEPDLDQAAALMRRVYEDPTGAAEVGARAREQVGAQLSPQATGAGMRRRLQELAGSP